MTFAPHIPNREALGAADHLEAFTPPDSMKAWALTDDEISAIRRDVEIGRVAGAIGRAITTLRPDVQVDGYFARYPNGEADLDLRALARRMIDIGTYHV